MEIASLVMAMRLGTRINEINDDDDDTFAD